jgi:hypothetical protein
MTGPDQVLTSTDHGGRRMFTIPPGFGQGVGDVWGARGCIRLDTSARSGQRERMDRFAE